METEIIKNPIKREQLVEIAKDQFGDLVKAVVDVEKRIMAIGGAMHADEEAVLIEQERSRREDTWGINIYPEKAGEDWIEFDSVVNLKPASGNRSRGIDNPETKEKIKVIVKELIL